MVGATGATGATGVALTTPDEMSNVGLVCSNNTTVLTCSLKQSDGSTDCGAGAAACDIGFRGTTAATASYARLSITAALSMDVSAGSTLGLVTGSVTQAVYIGVCNDAGTAKLAMSSVRWDEGELQSSTDEGGLGAADTAGVIYTDDDVTAVSAKACRVLGVADFSVAAPETAWDENPDKLAVYPYASVSPGNWYLDVNIGGANPSLGLVNVLSYTNISHESLDLVNNNAAVPVGIACGDPATDAQEVGDLTCSAAAPDEGPESLGVVFVPPITGTIKVCGTVVIAATSALSSNDLDVAMQWVRMPTNSVAIADVIEQGNDRPSLSFYNITAGSAISSAFYICSDLAVTAETVTIFRIYYEQTVSGTLSSILVAAAREAGVGQRDVHITARYINWDTR